MSGVHKSVGMARRREQSRWSARWVRRVPSRRSGSSADDDEVGRRNLAGIGEGAVCRRSVCEADTGFEVVVLPTLVQCQIAPQDQNLLVDVAVGVRWAGDCRPRWEFDLGQLQRTVGDGGSGTPAGSPNQDRSRPVRPQRARVDRDPSAVLRRGRTTPTRSVRVEGTVDSAVRPTVATRPFHPVGVGADGRVPHAAAGRRRAGLASPGATPPAVYTNDVWLASSGRANASQSMIPGPATACWNRFVPEVRPCGLGSAHDRRNSGLRARSSRTRGLRASRCGTPAASG